MPLGDAITRFVKPGMTLHWGYFDARPHAAVMELVRRFAGQNPGFTISSGGLVCTQAPLVTEGLMTKAIGSFFGDNYPNGAPNPIYQNAVNSGQLEIENWTLWTLIARLVAGGLNVPFLPVRSLKGSSMVEVPGYGVVKDPFSGEEVPVVKALRPDLVFVHGVAADPYGNVIASPPYGESHWGALAAKVGVIATVERIVDTDFIRRHSPLVRIPGHTVLSVSHTPLGSHPYGLYNPNLPGQSSYVEDEPFIVNLRQMCKDPEALRAWTREWILDLPDHSAYLHKLGKDRIERLLGAGQEDAWLLEGHTAPVDTGIWMPEEMMVVASARHMANRARAANYRLLMAGIGFSNLAAYLAAADLRESGHDIDLMAEIGMVGYSPRPGEPFIFSNRNLPTCTYLTDVMGVLGGLVGRDAGDCLAALGAGMIDRFGNINSTRTADGKFMVGSGGANDIASNATEVIVTVKQSRRRMVADVPFITSPGTRVRAIVSTEAIYEKMDSSGELVLTQYFPVPGKSMDEVISGIRSRCGWELQVARQPESVSPPTFQELERVRMFDPKRVFLGGE